MDLHVCGNPIPHRNASSVRLLFMMKKIYIEDRFQLYQAAITALLSVKVNMNCLCYQYDFGPDMPEPTTNNK